MQSKVVKNCKERERISRAKEERSRYDFKYDEITLKSSGVSGLAITDQPFVVLPRDPRTEAVIVLQKSKITNLFQCFYF